MGRVFEVFRTHITLREAFLTRCATPFIQREARLTPQDALLTLCEGVRTSSDAGVTPSRPRPCTYGRPLAKRATSDTKSSKNLALAERLVRPGYAVKSLVNTLWRLRRLV